MNKIHEKYNLHKYLPGLLFDFEKKEEEPTKPTPKIKQTKLI